MGAETYLTEIAPGARTPTLKAGRAFDLPLLVVTVVLIVFGLIMMFSASWDYSLTQYGAPMYMFDRQAMWLAVGLVAAVALTLVDYHLLRKLVVPAMVITVILLLVVLFMQIRLGAKRALYEGSYQPSELAKLVTIIYLSVWLYAKRDFLHDVSLGLIPLGVILGVVGGLIYQQPDLSAAATILIMGGLLFFLAGGDLKQIGLLLIVAVIAGFFVVQISPTGRSRVAEFLAGLKDPTQASYHVQRSFEAIVNGGWFGVGIGRAESKLTGLPVPPTDSIFAVVVEELGFIGASCLIALYVVVVWRGFVIARRAPDMFGTLLATGLVAWIGLEAGINMMVLVGLLPFAGNALPFVSAGGSNLVASLMAIGIVLNISRQRGKVIEDKEEERRPVSAAPNLRGWHRRRRVSRPRGARSAER